MNPSNSAQAELREQLAAIEHERWADWQAWCHRVIREQYGKSLGLEKVLARWDHQIATPYGQLTEAEKNEDRKQVDRYWPLIAKLIDEEREKLLHRVADELSYRIAKGDIDMISINLEQLMQRLKG